MILGKLKIPQVGTTLKNGLISCWEFEETTGTTVYDSHGANNMVRSGATVNQAGKTGKAYSFDGNDYLYKNPSTMFQNLPGLSVSAWVYPTFTTSSDYYLIIVSKLHSSWVNPNYQFQLRVRLGSYKLFEWVVGQASTFKGISTAANTYGNNAWVFLVGTYDGQTLRIYMNGSLKSSDSFASPGPTGNATSNLYIGDDADLYANFREWQGKIDQVGIWNRALTGDEVNQLYNSGNGLIYSGW